MSDRQEDSHNFSQLFDRIESVRVALGFTWDQLAEKLGYNRSFFFQIKQGKSGMSARGIHRLELAEAEAGIAPPATQSAAVPGALHDPDQTTSQLTADEKALLDDLRAMSPKARAAVLPWICGLAHALASLAGETHAALGGRDRQTGGLTGSSAALPEQRISTTETLPGVEPTVAKVAREGAVRAARVRRKAADR